MKYSPKSNLVLLMTELGSWDHIQGQIDAVYWLALISNNNNKTVKKFFTVLVVSSLNSCFDFFHLNFGNDGERFFNLKFFKKKSKLL